MIKKNVVFKVKNINDISDEMIINAIKSGELDRIDVTREEVLKRLRQKNPLEYKMSNELYDYTHGDKSINPDSWKKRVELISKLEKTNYYKVYENILNSFPIDCNKVREKLKLYEYQDGYGFNIKTSIYEESF